MQQQYTEVKKKLQDRIAFWDDLIRPRWVRVDHVFLETVHDGDPFTIADTEGYWQYHHAKVRWFLGRCTSLSDEDIDNAIVHEYVHVLLSPIEGKIPSKFNEQAEFAVDEIALALVRLWKSSSRPLDKSKKQS